MSKQDNKTFFRVLIVSSMTVAMAIVVITLYNGVTSLTSELLICLMLLFVLISMWLIRDGKRVAKVVKHAEERVSGIIEMAHDAVISVDPHMNIVLFNQSAEKMFGYSRYEVMGKHVNLLIPNEYRPTHDEYVEKFVREKQTMKGKTQVVALHKSGKVFAVEGTVSTYGEGNDRVFTVMLHDVSESKAKDEQLQQLFQAVEQGGEAIFITDKNSIIEYVNPAFTQITGYDEKDVVGRLAKILKSGAQDNSFYKSLWDTISSGEVWHGSLIDKKKDGTLYPAMVSISPIQNEQGEITHFVSVQKDMTKHQLLEEKLLQSQKLEAIGTLVGGVAHDFNNMLAGVMGNVFLLKKQLEENSYAVEKLTNIDLLTKRAASMIKQMLVFAREDMVNMRSFAVVPFFKEALKLSRSTIPENITFERKFSADHVNIKGDTTQLQQLTMNLLNNAKDAVEHVAYPRIVFEIKAVTVDRFFLEKYPQFNSEELLCISVSDNGSGIPLELQGRIFEPFFTTKGVGKGTGLGLSMVFGAVQRHEGIIELESRLGEGTRVDIYLPQSEANHEDERKYQAKEIHSSRGELVLLVDDEESMLEATSEVLDFLGYKVIEAGNGQIALDILKSKEHKVELLFTDIVMPEMGGLELAEEARKLYPEMPILFTTGYDRDNDFDESIEITNSRLVNKPFDIGDLSRVIYKLLS